MVCTISGLCSDTLLVQTDPDADGCYEEEAELEAEVFMDKSRLGTYLSISLSLTHLLFHIFLNFSTYK